MNWTNWQREIEFGSRQIEAIKMMMIRDMPSPEFLERNPGDKPMAQRVYRAIDKLDEARAILNGDDND